MSLHGPAKKSVIDFFFIFFFNHEPLYLLKMHWSVGNGMSFHCSWYLGLRSRLTVFSSIITSEKLESEKLNVAEVTQSEIAQKQKLQTVLEKINETLKLPPRNIKWNVDCKLHILVKHLDVDRIDVRVPTYKS